MSTTGRLVLGVDVADAVMKVDRPVEGDDVVVFGEMRQLSAEGIGFEVDFARRPAANTVVDQNRNTVGGLQYLVTHGEHLFGDGPHCHPISLARSATVQLRWWSLRRFLRARR